MRISNRTFGGERPKRDPRNLESDESVIALDCDLVSTTLRPLHSHSIEKFGISEQTQTIQYFNDTWFEFDDELDIIELSDRLFWTGPDGPRQATYAQLQAGLSYAMGVPKPDAPTASTTGTNSGDPFDTFYVVAFVNQFSEQGDKSDPSSIITVQGIETVTVPPGNTVTVVQGSVVTLGNIGISNQSDPLTATDSGVTLQRIYRLSEGEVKFVAEVPATDTSFTEVIGEVVLGEVFAAEDFLPPPSNMTGLHLMANGIALGFVAGTNTVYVSEPFNANAWPYFFPAESRPVGISSYDNNAVIVTDSYPEVATITDPRNIVPTTLTYREPCQSKRSLVQAEGGVIYSSANGLFYVGRGGGKRITEEHVDAADWNRYSPSTILALYTDRQYIGFHNGLKEGNALVFDMRGGRNDLRQLSQAADAVFVKPGTNDAYVAFGGAIRKLGGGEDLLTYTYRSKTFGTGRSFALTSRRVLALLMVDRNHLHVTDEAKAIIYAERAATLLARSALSNCFGMGGCINQHLIAGCPEISPAVLGSVSPTDFRSINGIAAQDIPRFEDHVVVLNVYGDEELIHTETIISDCTEKRLTYADRRRFYIYELIGNIEVSQVDLASSNSELYDA